MIGEKIIREYPNSIQCIISSEPTPIRAKKSYLVTEEILQKIGGLGNIEGVFAEVDLPVPQSVEGKNYILILDQIQDPGNLGTLLRTALALGWEGVIATPGTVDFFNDKALRASQGAIFRLPFSIKTPEEILAWRESRNIPIWVADAKAPSCSKSTFSSPLALVLSHEGQGVRKWAKSFHSISIPLQNNVESLNVAAAGAILLYHMRALL